MANGDIDDIEIDEELFDGEDLDQVEEDLETLDLDDWSCDGHVIWNGFGSFKMIFDLK